MPHLTVTDFNPAEDALVVNVGDAFVPEVSEIAIEDAADGSHTLITVSLPTDDTTTFADVVIRLDGVTGLSADALTIQFEAVTPLPGVEPLEDIDPETDSETPPTAPVTDVT